MSAEGTTPDDPLAMGLYAISIIQPLITSLQAASSVKQCCLQMLLVELAVLSKLGRGGMPLAHLVRILVIFRTTDRMLDHRKTS